METSAVHRLVEQQAARAGDVLALVDRDRSLTYRELNQRANAKARQLIERGLRRGAVVEVRGAHSLELVVTLLAVLKAVGRMRGSIVTASHIALTWIFPSIRRYHPRRTSRSLRAVPT